MFGIGRCGSSASVLDFVRFGSPMSFRSYARCGSAVSVFGIDRCDRSASVVDFLHLSSSMSLRSHACCGSTPSVNQRWWYWLRVLFCSPRHFDFIAKSSSLRQFRVGVGVLALGQFFVSSPLGSLRQCGVHVRYWLVRFVCVRHALLGSASSVFDLGRCGSSASIFILDFFHLGS